MCKDEEDDSTFPRPGHAEKVSCIIMCNNEDGTAAQVVDIEQYTVTSTLASMSLPL